MSKYIVKVIATFSAAHRIPGHTRGCGNLHGHNWRVDVEVETSSLDNLGMAIDFYEIKQITRKYTEQLDHTYLNEQPPFDQISPTSENIAKYLYQNIESDLTGYNAGLIGVTVWETDTCCVRYTEVAA